MNPKKFVLFLLILSASTLCAQVKNKTNSFTTYTYKVVGNDTLQMDYFPARGKQRPITILFVHGGSFMNGKKENQHPFALPMQALGYNVAVISYRLYLKGKSFDCNTSLNEKITAIRTAVNDTRSATRFLLDKAAALNIDSNTIVLAGSSAGAETVLHTAFWKHRFLAEDSTLLPDSFRYAALLSFAGALTDINLVGKDNAIPALLYHGICDQLVPYAAAPHHYCNAGSPGWMILFGSQSIYERYLNLQRTVSLQSFCGGGHEVSNFMFRDSARIHRFLQEAVVEKKNFREHNLQQLSTKDCSNRVLLQPSCQ